MDLEQQRNAPNDEALDSAYTNSQIAGSETQRLRFAVREHNLAMQEININMHMHDIDMRLQQLDQNIESDGEPGRGPSSGSIDPGDNCATNGHGNNPAAETPRAAGAILLPIGRESQGEGVSIEPDFYESSSNDECPGPYDQDHTTIEPADLIFRMHQNPRPNNTSVNGVLWNVDDYPWIRIHERYANGDEGSSRSRSPTLNHGSRAGEYRYNESPTPAPAQEVLHEGFYGIFPWARGINPFDETETVWRPAEWYLENRNRNRISTEPLDETAEVPPAIAFVNGLISLEMDDLDDGDQTCAICLQRYREGESSEMPVELPCKHVVGRECLLTWFTDPGDNVAHEHGGSCPVCRKNYIQEKRERPDTDEGLRQLLRDATYLLTGVGPLRLTTEGREQWESVKAYVNSHLQEEAERKRQVQERFMMLMRQNIYREPVLETIVANPEELKALHAQLIGELEDLERRGIISEYLEENSFTAEADLVVEISENLAAAPGVIRRVMDNIRNGRFGYYDYTNGEPTNVEEAEAEIEAFDRTQ